MSYEERESDIQSSIIEYLRYRGYIVFKANSTQFGIRDGKAFAFSSAQKGVSDIIACGDGGRYLAVEVKKRGGYPTTEQVDFIKSIRSKGGIALVAYSLDDVIAEIANPGTIPIPEARDKKPRKVAVSKAKNRYKAGY